MENIFYSDLLDNNLSFTNLFVDYIEQKPSITKFFNESNIQNISTWKKVIDGFKINFSNRNELIQILNEQNKSLHCSVQTLSNLDLLQNKNTFCVVTGQQPGIFSGPLYTIYKIISTIKLTESLSKEFPNYNFVPLFWVESNDSDIPEISKIGLINNNNEFKESIYDFFKNDLNLKSNTPFKNIKLNDYFSSFIDDNFSSLQKSDFSDIIKTNLKNYYSSSNSIVNAFNLMISDLFRDFGLIIVDPSDAKIKYLLKNIFIEELTTESETSQLVIKSSVELEKHYFAQTQPRPINLFFEFQDGRYPINEDENGFFLQGTRKRFTKEEILNLVETNPELFSPNVILRPICQDFLFPTISYVAGPSEIAYFAQLKNVYDKFKITMPVIFPRASCTLIEDKINTVIENYNISPLKILNNFNLLKNEILENVSDIKIDDLFLSTLHRNKDIFKELQFAISEIDPTLDNSVNNLIQKLENNLNVLKEKVRTAQTRKEEILVSKLIKSKTYLFPQSALQERKLNIIYFMNKYGNDIIKWLYNEISITEFRHQLIQI